MTFVAPVSIGTPFFIFGDVFLDFPFGTRDRVVIEYLWFPSEVLPIMSIYTKRFVMVGKVEWAPDSFVMKHVEIFIINIIVNQFHFYFFLGMSEAAELSIFTFFQLFRVESAEFRLVFFRPEKLFYSIMTLLTIVTFRTLLFLHDVLTQLRGIIVTLSFISFSE